MYAGSRASRGSGAIGRGVAVLLGLAVAGLTAPDASALHAPNVVVVAPNLMTAGQPPEAELRRLAAEGFEAVVYLSPANVAGDVPGEADIVRAQGLAFVSIPIVYNHPTEADFRRFVEAMNRLAGRKVLVHCQLNLYASTMTFLYRTIVRGEQPEQAYEAVARVWSPNTAWKGFAVEQLSSAGIAFEPY